VFDWQSNTDFKFAGIDISTNKIEIGHRTASGWVVDAWTNAQLKAGTDYVVMLQVNGTAVTLTQGMNKVSFTFAPHFDSFGLAHGINEGMVGIGATGGASAQIDDVVVQAPPRVITLDRTADFGTVLAGALFNSSTGSWTTTADGRFVGTATTGAAVNLGRYPVTPGAMIDFSTKLSTSGQGGIVFDYQGANYYKFVTLSVATNQILIGHVTQQGTVIDKSYAVRLSNGTDYTLGVNVRGGLVNVSLNGAVVASKLYNETATTFGGYGTLALSGTTSFDSVRLRTDDASYAVMLEADALPAGAGQAQGSLSQQQLDATLAAATQAWAASGVDALTLGRAGLVTLQVADLGGSALGADFGSSILIDSNAAGWRWSTLDAPAPGGMDLLTVVTHELGHALGFDHDGGNDVMAPTLQAGVNWSNGIVPTLSECDLDGIAYVFAWALEGVDPSPPTAATVDCT